MLLSDTPTFQPRPASRGRRGSVAIAYRSVEDLVAIEALELDDNRRVSRALGHYRRRPAGQRVVSELLIPHLPTTAAPHHDASKGASSCPLTPLAALPASTSKRCPNSQTPGGRQPASPAYRPNPAALVTGAGRGIGRLLALRLASVGYAVGLIARSEDELDETRRLVQASGGCATALVADVTDTQAAPDVVQQLEHKYGPVDTVNNAGILGPIGPAWEVDLESWWRTLEVNLLGTLVYTRAALAPMVERRRGRIINITSQAGAFRWPVVSAYSVSKAATIKLTENLAIEARRHRVSIFSVHPGLLPIGLSETALDPEAHPGSNKARVYAWAQQQIAEGRGAKPDHAINQILQLASGRYDQLWDATSPCTTILTRSSPTSTTCADMSCTSLACTAS